MTSFLVTGATGFIGQHVVDGLLRRGFAVRALIRSDREAHGWGNSVEIARGDLLDTGSLRPAAEGVEGVFHLAAKVHDLEELGDSGEHEAVTRRGTQNLLVAAAESRVKRFVFMSSLSVYGAPSTALRDETAQCAPTSAYGQAKLVAEQCVLGYGKKSGAHVSCLRPAMVYGVGGRGNLPRMIKMIDRGGFPPLPHVKNRRSMVHVSDVAEAAILAANHPAANGQCYIVTDGRSYSTRELYEMICRGLGKSIPRWNLPLGALKALAGVGDIIGRLRGRRFVFDSDAIEKLTGNAWFSSEKISRELGYKPRVTFEDALPEMIASYRGTQVPPTC